MTIDVTEALLFHAQLRREEIPAIAVALLETGTDTPTLRRLAGLTASELSEAHDLFRRILQELGRRPPTVDEAAKTVARYLASLALAERTNLRQLAADGARLAAMFNYHNALMPFLQADDEYDLPEYSIRAEVDRELVEYARILLGNEPGRAVLPQPRKAVTFEVSLFRGGAL
jgi:hypothetical protein